MLIAKLSSLFQSNVTIAGVCLMLTTASAPLIASEQKAPFLTSSVSNATPYVGEELTLHYTLYFQNVAPKIVRESQPSMQGLWAQASNPERFISSKAVLFQGNAYRRAVIKSYRVAPLQSGGLTVSGYSMDYVFNEVAKEQGRTIAAPPVTITARSLPTPIPQDYSGAVGHFAIELLPSTTSLHVGEALTLTMTIRGNGNFFTLTPPTIVVPKGFRADIANKNIKEEGGQNSNVLTVTQTIWADEAGSFTIPAIEFTAFNPQTRSYSTQRTKPFTITVEAVQQAMSNSNNPQEKPLAAPLASNDTQESFFSSLAFIMGCLLLLLFGGGTWLWRNRTRNHHPQTATTTTFAQVQSVTARSAKEQLFAQLEIVGINRPSGLTRHELQQELCNTTLTPAMQQQLMELLDALDALLYAPNAAANPSLSAELIAQVSLLDKNLSRAKRKA